MPELVGVLVGDYFLLECLAREGITETYRARPTMRGGYDVILRLFRPQFPDSTGFREHFATEVEKVWRCRHEHIQPLLEFGTGDDLLFCVTRLDEAETLAQHLKRRGETPVPVDMAVRMVTELCAAVQYAHEQDIVHGNIQPSSILLGSDGQILLTNFGMRRAYREGDPPVSQLREGNPAYMAPEQSLGMISPACDIYAIGVLLYRLIGGALPFDGESTEEIALQHADDVIPSLRALRPELPLALEEVVRAALAKSPQERFATPAALAQALQESLSEGRVPLVRETQERRIPVRAWRTPVGRQHAASLITLTVLLFGLVGASFFIFSLPQSLAPFRNIHAWNLRLGPMPTATAARNPPAVTATPSPNLLKVAPATGKTPPVLATGMPTTASTPAPSPPRVDCAGGTLTIDGSANLDPLLTQIGNDYEQACPDVMINVQGNGSRTGLNQVQQGEINVAACDLTARSSRGLVDHPIGAMLYAIITSPDVSLSGLSSAQIQAIYQGQITNWAQVGGPNEPITVVQHPAYDPVAMIFRAFVLQGTPEHVHGLRLKAGWAQAVAQMVGAISYVPLADTQGVNVRTLAINGATPDSASVIAGAYPFWSVQHLYTRGNGDAQFQAYVPFLAASQESSVLSRFGVVPFAELPSNVLSSHLPGPEI